MLFCSVTQATGDILSGLDPQARRPGPKVRSVRLGKIETAFIEDIAVIDLGERKLVGEHGDYDLWSEVESLLKNDKKKIILDLSSLQWSNSTGIGILVSAWTMAQKEKAELVVVNSAARLDNIFKVTNLKYIMKIFKTVDEAVVYLKSIW
jgi:anti-sigma B factor antagonist